MRDAPFSLRVGVRLGAFVFMFFPLITIGIPLPSFLLPAKTLDRYAAKNFQPSDLSRPASGVPRQDGGRIVLGSASDDAKELCIACLPA
ncbi:MAG: hypothetical protein IPK60_09560 [Sandaracinaceae bacterium]|nr:hypothetical protein [Sandaracinaceae bacterium]